MRLLILQTSPTLGSLAQNLQGATNLLQSVPSGRPSPDLIILPELAFTGYNFRSPEQIAPYIETREKSPSKEWAERVAREWGCSVLVGMPLRNERGMVQNTAMVVDREGEVLSQFAKVHMYETDYRWGCSPGPGFSSFEFPIHHCEPSKTTPERNRIKDTPHVNDIPIHHSPTTNSSTDKSNAINNESRTITTSIGICMDLNPKDFLNPKAYEFPNYILSYPSISLILLPMAWLRNSSSPDSTSSGPGQMTLEYWIKRLDPLIWAQRRRWVVICNRTGEEEGACYAGTSCVLRVGRGEVIVKGVLGREEGYLEVEIDL